MLAAAAAVVTSRIQLGDGGGAGLALRHPISLANDVANVDYLSGGRMNLGLSLGGRPEEFEAMGVPFGRRMGRYEETLSLLPRLWTEDSVTHHGQALSSWKTCRWRCDRCRPEGCLCCWRGLV